MLARPVVARARAAVLLVGAGQAGPAQLRPQPAPDRDHRGRADGRHRADHRRQHDPGLGRQEPARRSPTTQVNADLFISGDQTSDRPPTFDPAVLDQDRRAARRRVGRRRSTGTPAQVNGERPGRRRGHRPGRDGRHVRHEADRRQPRQARPGPGRDRRGERQGAGPDGRLDGAGAVRPRRAAHADDRRHLRQERDLQRLHPVAVGDPGHADPAAVDGLPDRSPTARRSADVRKQVDALLADSPEVSVASTERVRRPAGRRSSTRCC